MSLTLDEITNRMRKAYFDEVKTGVVPYSDTDNRIKAVATELFSAYSYGDYIFRQAFAQTATGKYLEYHAQLRGIFRKKATASSGVLTFFMAEPAKVQAVIPKGTVCSVAESPFIQFETTEDAVIAVGKTSVDVPSLAIETGDRFNVAENKINTIVNPPKYVGGVINNAEFTGGTDDETDESLRGRVLEIYKYEFDGLNEASFRKLILECDDILDASVIFEDGFFNVFLKTPSDRVEIATMQHVIDKIGFIILFNFKFSIGGAKPKEYDVEINIKANSGADSDKIKEQAESRVRDYCGNGKIGAPLRAYDLAKALADLPDAGDVNISLTPSVQDTVICPSSQYLKLNELQVNVYE